MQIQADPGGDIFDKNVSNLTLTLQQFFQKDITDNDQETAEGLEAEAFEEEEKDNRLRKKDEDGPSDTEKVGEEVRPREQDEEKKNRLSDIKIVGRDDVTARQDIQEGLSARLTYNFAVVIEVTDKSKGQLKKHL